MTTSQERLSRLEGAYEQVDQRLGDLAGSMESLRGEMNTRLDGIDRRFDAMDIKFDSLRRDIDNKINTLIVVIATVSTALAGLVIGLNLWGG